MWYTRPRNLQRDTYTLSSLRTAHACHSLESEMRRRQKARLAPVICRSVSPNVGKCEEVRQMEESGIDQRSDSSSPSSSLAGWSLGLGIASLVFLGPLSGIPAIICGHKARARIRKSPQSSSGQSLATAGLITGYIGTISSTIVFLLLGGSIIGGLLASPFIYTTF